LLELGLCHRLLFQDDDFTRQLTDGIREDGRDNDIDKPQEFFFFCIYATPLKNFV